MKIKTLQETIIEDEEKRISQELGLYRWVAYNEVAYATLPPYALINSLSLSRRRTGKPYWLRDSERTPSVGTPSVGVVYGNGQIGIQDVEHGSYIRPLLVVPTLNSPEYNLGEMFWCADMMWSYAGQGYLLSEEFLPHIYPFDINGKTNDYQKSSIKEVIDDWWKTTQFDRYTVVTREDDSEYFQTSTDVQNYINNYVSEDENIAVINNVTGKKVIL